MCDTPGSRSLNNQDRNFPSQLRGVHTSKNNLSSTDGIEVEKTMVPVVCLAHQACTVQNATVPSTTARRGAFRAGTSPLVIFSRIIGPILSIASGGFR
jgi:hypothetical protein